MALTLEEKQYFDRRFDGIEQARHEDRAYFTGLFNAALREISKKFDSVQKQLDAIKVRMERLEERVGQLETRVAALEKDIKEIKLDLQDVRARVFDAAQRTEWLSLVRRVEVLEKDCK